MGNFSEIKTRNDFADFLRIPRNKLTHILYVKKPDSYYKTFEIPKKNGDKRKICAPSGDLKAYKSNLRMRCGSIRKAYGLRQAPSPIFPMHSKKEKVLLQTRKFTEINALF